MLNKNTVIDLTDEDIDRKYNMTIDNNICVSNITTAGRNSTMYSCGDEIFVATFNEEIDTCGEVVKFKIDSISEGYYIKKDLVNEWINKEIKTSIVYKYEIPDFTQGVLKTTYNGTNYVITSQSYSNAKSILTIEKEIDNNLEYVGSFVIDHPGMESLHVDDNNKIICVFENGTCDIYETNMKTLLKKLDNDEEVKKARREQVLYNDLDKAYKALSLAKQKYQDFGVSFQDIRDVFEQSKKDFFIGTFKEIPNSWKNLIDFNVKIIELLCDFFKVVPVEVKKKIYK